MTTYHISIYKKYNALYAGMDTLSSRELQLNDEQDFAKAAQLCENRKNMAGFLKQTVLPIRTNRASDLFFPTLMNLVIKTKNCAKNCFAVMGAIIWDLVTLPIRILTFLPRMGYNAIVKPAEHPLIPYLNEKGLPIHSIKGRVNIVLYRKTIQEGREQRNWKLYCLHLTNRDIAFPIYGNSFGYSHHNRPLPILAPPPVQGGC